MGSSQTKAMFLLVFINYATKIQSKVVYTVAI